jgi:DNA polymerase sigma
MTSLSTQSLGKSLQSFLHRYSKDFSYDAVECLKTGSIGIGLFLLRSVKDKGDRRWDLNKFFSNT